MDFNGPPVKNTVIMWFHDLMINRPEEFESYDKLEAHVRNHMLNETTKFFSCNKKELNNIFNHYKRGIKDVS